jgi:hypothetical protein
MDGGDDTEITIFVFRLLVLDLLALFHVLNQALINILRGLLMLSVIHTHTYSLSLPL